MSTATISLSSPRKLKSRKILSAYRLSLKYDGKDPTTGATILSNKIEMSLVRQLQADDRSAWLLGL